MTTDEQDRDRDEGSEASRTTRRDPERELELKLKKHPEDLDAKADVGSDESMDASDPISVTQPGSSEPAPSSGYPDK